MLDRGMNRWIEKPVIRLVVDIKQIVNRVRRALFTGDRSSRRQRGHVKIRFDSYTVSSHLYSGAFNVAYPQHNWLLKSDIVSKNYLFFIPFLFLLSLSNIKHSTYLEIIMSERRNITNLLWIHLSYYIILNINY